MTNSGSTRTIVQLFTKGCRMRGVERRTPPATVPGQPPAQGLYDPRDEHDACGVGFVVNIKGKKSHTIVRQALRSEEHTSELQSPCNLVCRLLLEKKKNDTYRVA